ncbi:MAG TPA: endopeptidase La [Xanthomonadales bacterium]
MKPDQKALDPDSDKRTETVAKLKDDTAVTKSARVPPDDAMIIMPWRNSVLFPGTILPMTINRERSLLAVQDAARLQRPIGILLQRQETDETPGPEQLYEMGTTANVLRYITTPFGTHHAICQGVQRFRVVQFLEGYPYLVARVQLIPPVTSTDADIEGRAHNLRQKSKEILEMLPQVPEGVHTALMAMESPENLADFVASQIDIEAVDKQKLLETLDLKTRLDQLLNMLNHRLEVLKISNEIDQRTRDALTERNRRHLLREQMQTIQKELGEDEAEGAEIAELESKIDAAQMPEEVEQQARKELKRLARTPEGAGEYSMIRTYIDWLIELPWGPGDKTPIDIAEARRILDEDHFGLDKIKKRILEYLAVRKLNPEGRTPILCFVGPPGVGKTSLGQSIARATGRRFARLSLGGVHDESEIRGHRRTYIGALPGNVIQQLRRAGTRNCLMMLDEVDKLGAGGFQGDPASALLEVLDPEQNSSFRDSYLAVPFDLSAIMFICTANQLDTIPGPLRDRMEIIELSSYTSQEKLQIARRYLVGRQLKDTGLSTAQCDITDAALTEIIEKYTREAGVRNLEREIGRVFRNIAVRIAEGKTEKLSIDVADLPAILGPPRYEAEVAMRAGIPGVATGLAWTPVGGDILFIEASRSPGTGKLTLTGQLGDVMKESAQAALSLIKARAQRLGIAQEVLDKSDIHIHVPAGATPKDGPSAGVAMFTALASLLSGRSVKSEVAMTGEISLRGLVLPIGGIKEKVLAALRAGITTVLLPERNRRDLEEIPEEVRQTITIEWVNDVDEALSKALENPL